MPTPYGSRGGMAFCAEELRVLRRALAVALHPSSASAEDVQNCLRLAESVDEAAREGARLRAFLLADLARYRAALPGAVSGYLALLEDALGAGYRPDPDDLAALRALRGSRTAAALLDRCRALAARMAAPTIPSPAVPASRARLLALPGGRSAENTRKEKGQNTVRAFTERPAETQDEKLPEMRTGMLIEMRTGKRTGMPTENPTAKPREKSAGTLAEKPSERQDEKPGEKPSERQDEKPGEKPDEKPGEKPGEKSTGKPAERPARSPKPQAPSPSRPVPTPGEVFPPKRKPAAPPATPPQQLAAD